MKDSDKDKLYRHLVILLKIFRDRPNHLAKYLIQNTSFTKDFIKKINTSKKLSEISDMEIKDMMGEIESYFTDIDEMDSFYNNLLTNDSTDGKDKVIELNEKLKDLIKTEKYEEAARIRDYMSKNGIKIDDSI